MNWLRSIFRTWLGLDGFVTYSEFIAYQEGQQQIQTALQTQLTESKEALKKRAAVPVRAVPRYVDYETAQVEALEDFKEKVNGIQS